MFAAVLSIFRARQRLRRSRLLLGGSEVRDPGLRRWCTSAMLVIALGLIAACDDARFPRDPGQTLEAVLATGRIRVAFSDHAPWVNKSTDGPPAGAEAEMVKTFAKDLGVEVEWQAVPAFEALEALEQGSADLAIGGFTKSDVKPRKGVAPTYSYFSEVLLVATEPGSVPLDSLEGQRVFVPQDVRAGNLVQDKGGVPVSTAAGGVDLFALPHWKLPSLGLVPSGVVLQRRGHVMAIPQGENAWLMRIERFLRDHSLGLEQDLREHSE